MPRLPEATTLVMFALLTLGSCEATAPPGASSPPLECGEPAEEGAIRLRPNGLRVDGTHTSGAYSPELRPWEVCSQYQCFDLCGDTIVMAEPSTLPQLDVEFSFLSRPVAVRTYHDGTVALAGSSLQIFDTSRSLLGEARISGAAGALEVVTDLAFVGTRSGGKSYIQVVDLDDERTPRVVSRWSMLNDERGFSPQLVGRADGELVLAGSTDIAYVAVTESGAPEVTRCVPISFVDEGGWYWDIDVNDRFLVVSGVSGSEAQVDGAEAVVYPLSGNDRWAIDILMENTPVLEGDRLLITTRGREGAVYRLSDSEPPRPEATLARPFFDWEPPHIAGLAFLDDDFVLDLRSDDLRVYESLNSTEYDCVLELSSGEGRIALAPFFAPDSRFPAGEAPQHDCGIKGSTIFGSEGIEAMISTGRCGLTRVNRGGGFPDPLVGSPEAQATLDEARIYAWWGGRIAAERYSRIDILSSETGEAIGHSQVLPGAVRDFAGRGSQVVILAEPYPVGDIEDPRAPPGDWLIFALDLRAPSPELRGVDKPEGLEVVQVVLDDSAIHGISVDGKLHSWSLDGGPPTSRDFLSDTPNEVFASALGLFAATESGWWYWDGSTARPVVIPHPRASISGVDDTFVYWHYPRGETFAAPDDDHLVLADATITDAELQTNPRYVVPVQSDGGFVAGKLIVVSPLAFYARPGDARSKWIEDAESEVAGGVLFPGDEIPDPSP